MNKVRDVSELGRLPLGRTWSNANGGVNRRFSRSGHAQQQHDNGLQIVDRSRSMRIIRRLPDTSNSARSSRGAIRTTSSSSSSCDKLLPRNNNNNAVVTATNNKQRVRRRQSPTRQLVEPNQTNQDLTVTTSSTSSIAGRWSNASSSLKNELPSLKWPKRGGRMDNNNRLPLCRNGSHQSSSNASYCSEDTRMSEGKLACGEHLFRRPRSGGGCSSPDDSTQPTLGESESSRSQLLARSTSTSSLDALRVRLKQVALKLEGDPSMESSSSSGSVVWMPSYDCSSVMSYSSSIYPGSNASIVGSCADDTIEFSLDSISMRKQQLRMDDGDSKKPPTQLQNNSFSHYTTNNKASSQQTTLSLNDIAKLEVKMKNNRMLLGGKDILEAQSFDSILMGKFDIQARIEDDDGASLSSLESGNMLLDDLLDDHMTLSPPGQQPTRSKDYRYVRAA